MLEVGARKPTMVTYIHTGQRRRSSARREHRRRREVGKVIKPGRVPKQLRVSRCKEEMAGLLEEKALQDEVFGVESELIDGSDLEDLIASRVVSRMMVA